ncbi:DedA family protein [Neotabrizicola sp. VNH66]|uniref:DedA family protein n=1 Tax=Neotabrizicola sp. VNH66 TaxID=3400918 RepID=UPI003C0A0F91
MGHQIEALIAAGGPFAVFLGCFLEGETAAVLGGLIAHRSLAPYPLIAGLAFLGAFLADVMWFLLSRRAPDRGPVRRLRAKAAQSPFAARLHRNADLMTFAFRFLPGTRILGPVLLAQTPLPVLRFVLLNALASALWAGVFTGIGWQFGLAAEGIFGRLAAHHWLIALAVLAVAAVALHLWLSRRSRS